ncbi:MAG: hypothetical protein HYW45_01145 [Candidatus Daviesbacteria bacterium]|nr:MAG: hypothetical protein HYW45_01145 [Candidatus Daviesbacteria bacterium]
MPITQTRNQDLEKRLAFLRSQLYGKKSPNQQVSLSAVHQTNRSTDTLTHRPTDLSFLRQDLLRIFLLAGAAFAFQFGLYFALFKNIIKLPL